MGDTRVVVGDTGSLILNIFGLEKNWIDGNNITVPEKDARITDIEIMPDVRKEFLRHSQISWKIWAPHLTGVVVTKVEVQSNIGGIIHIAVEADKLLHIRWDPPIAGLTFRDWIGEDRGNFRSPANLKEARINQILVGDAPGFVFKPQPGKRSRMEVVSFGALFQFDKEPEAEQVVKKPSRKKVAARA